jgi:hypothetical protein
LINLIKNSYPERWRDRPIETSATDFVLKRYCANSSRFVFTNLKDEKGIIHLFFISKKIFLCSKKRRIIHENRIYQGLPKGYNK